MTIFVDRLPPDAKTELERIEQMPAGNPQARAMFDFIDMYDDGERIECWQDDVTGDFCLANQSQNIAETKTQRRAERLDDFKRTGRI